MMSLFTVEGLSGLLFLGFIGITLAGALIATSVRSLIRSVAGLALCFLGVAGLYYYLNSPFVALMQILIYVGAVCVTIIFAVMLAESSELKQITRRNDVVMPISAKSKTAIKTEYSIVVMPFISLPVCRFAGLPVKFQKLLNFFFMLFIFSNRLTG